MHRPTSCRSLHVLPLLRPLLRPIAAGLTLLVSTSPALALMAGSATGTPPDDPALRIDAAASPFAGVGSLTVNGSPYSGSVIGSRFVITAAHVVDGVAPDAMRFMVTTGGGTQSYGVANVYVHPDYTGFNNPDVNDDLAIVELATPVAADVPVYGLRRAPLATGTALTLVGYGASGYGDVGVTVGGSGTVRRVGQNAADAFSGDDERVKPLGMFEVYAFDFDGPDAGSNVFGGATLGNGVETTVAGGDSGSAALVPGDDGRWLLAGVNSFTASIQAGQPPGTFGTVGGGMLLSGYTEWIDGILSPVPEPGAWAQLGLGLAVLGLWRRRL